MAASTTEGRRTPNGMRGLAAGYTCGPLRREHVGPHITRRPDAGFRRRLTQRKLNRDGGSSSSNTGSSGRVNGWLYSAGWALGHLARKMWDNGRYARNSRGGSEASGQGRKKQQWRNRRTCCRKA